MPLRTDEGHLNPDHRQLDWVWLRKVSGLVVSNYFTAPRPTKRITIG